jgi:hypothetical protein
MYWLLQELMKNRPRQSFDHPHFLRLYTLAGLGKIMRIPLQYIEQFCIIKSPGYLPHLIIVQILPSILLI